MRSPNLRALPFGLRRTLGGTGHEQRLGLWVLDDDPSHDPDHHAARPSDDPDDGSSALDHDDRAGGLHYGAHDGLWRGVSAGRK